MGSMQFKIGNPKKGICAICFENRNVIGVTGNVEQVRKNINEKLDT